MIINVIVASKKAMASPHEPLVCGNSDYVIEFTFDEEWSEYQTKTARFIFDDRSYTDVVFDGNQCRVPILKDTHDVIVGVYAGNLRTTTPAYLHAQRSILCGCGAPAEPDPDVYAQIMEKLNTISDDIGGAVKDYLDKNPIEGTTFVTDETLTLSDDGILSVNRAEKVEKDNTLPVTSAAVYTEVGNINALLETI